MTDVEKLKLSLEQLSHVSTLFQTQATECERIYQSKDEIRKMIYLKTNQSLEYREKFLESIETLGTQVSEVSDILLQMWTAQDRKLTLQQSRIEKFCNRVDLFDKRMGVKYLGYEKEKDAKRNRKIVRTGVTRILPTHAVFKVDLYPTSQREILPRQRAMKTKEFARFASSENLLFSGSTEKLYQEQGSNLKYASSQTNLRSKGSYGSMASLKNLQKEKGSMTRLADRLSNILSKPPVKDSRRTTALYSPNVGVPPPPQGGILHFNQARPSTASPSVPRESVGIRINLMTATAANFSGSIPPPPPPSFSSGIPRNTLLTIAPPPMSSNSVPRKIFSNLAPPPIASSIPRTYTINSSTSTINGWPSTTTSTINGWPSAATIYDWTSASTIDVCTSTASYFVINLAPSSSEEALSTPTKKPKLSMQEELMLKAQKRAEREGAGESSVAKVVEPPKKVEALSFQDQLKAKMAKRAVTDQEEEQVTAAPSPPSTVKQAAVQAVSIPPPPRTTLSYLASTTRTSARNITLIVDIGGIPPPPPPMQQAAMAGGPPPPPPPPCIILV